MTVPPPAPPGAPAPGDRAPAPSSGAPTKSGGWRKPVVTALQVALTLTILYFIFRDPAKRAEMASAFVHADRWWLLAGFLIYGAVELLGALRWHLLLRVQGIVLPPARLVALLFIGVFFNFFIPGGTGGDVVRIFFLLKETPGKLGPALLSVFVDRLTGVLGLSLLAGVLVFARWDWIMSTPETSRLAWPALLILGSSFAGLHFTYIVTRHGWVHRLPAWMPGRDRLAEAALAYHLYGKAWRATSAAIAISAVANLGYFIVFYCAARALKNTGVHLPTFAEILSIMPIVNTIAAMPISLGGIGVREGLFEVFLGKLCGVSGAVAVTISSLGYLLTLGWGVVGGVIYLFYRPSDHARLRDIKNEVRAAEHALAEEEIALELALPSPDHKTPP